MRTPAQHMRDAGPWMVSAIALAVACIAVALVYLKLPAVVDAPLPTSVNIVPASGEQGFPVEPFCEDRLTAVHKVALVPPDSEFSAIYTLERTRDQVHELVTVKAYGDQGRQPVGTYNDDLHPAFVSRDAMKCILEKAK